MSEQYLPKAPKTTEEAIAYLNAYLDYMRGDSDRAQLTGTDPDTAFELGYETAIFDLRHAADEDTTEIGLVYMDVRDAGGHDA